MDLLADSTKTGVGKKNCPNEMEIVASTMQLPMMSPIANSNCFLRIAVKSTTSSGSDVPRASAKKLMKNSGISSSADNKITD